MANEPAYPDPVAQPAGFASRRFWIAAALIIIVLLAGYWLFVRETWSPVLANLEAQDAADIVKVLEQRKIEYRLADGGRTVLVPDNQADSARIELVGSELPMRGQVGFELFNQSDMGLTDFAQKINYQRALQGELARTILLLEGIQSVRVHLGIPEQGLFRDQLDRPRASVTLILVPGTTLTSARVRGIQRMVVGAIPEMTPEAVAVLDGTGRVVSDDASPLQPAVSTTDALIGTYRERALTAIRSVRPALAAEVVVSLRYPGLGSEPAAPGAGWSDGATDTGRSLPAQASTASSASSDPALNIRVMTREEIDEATRAELNPAIAAAVAFNSARGDQIVFVAGWAGAPQAQPSQEPDRVVAKRIAPSAEASPIVWTSWWPLAAFGVLALLVLAFLNDRRRARVRQSTSLGNFADALRERLAVAEGGAS